MIVYHLKLQHFAICQPQLAYQTFEDGYVPIKNSREIEAHMDTYNFKLCDLNLDVFHDEAKDEYYLESPDNLESDDDPEEQYVLIEEFVHPNSIKGLTDLGIKNAVDFINADEKDLLQISQITAKTLPILIDKAKKLLIFEPNSENKDEKIDENKDEKVKAPDTPVKDDKKANKKA